MTGTDHWGEIDGRAIDFPIVVDEMRSATLTFSVPAGCYDLKAEDSGHNVIETEMGINVAGTYDWYVTGGGGGGGKGDVATAGGKNPEGLSEALRIARERAATLVG